MSLNLETLKPNDSHYKLIALLKKGHVAIIEDETTFYGIITKIDFINYMKRRIKD
jgi:cystathionine beta-synthase